MNRLDRWLGLARSLVIYHGIPGRQRRLRRLYTPFVRAGDLVFDIGGHVGNRARAFRALGCRVVTVEPQPVFARLLRSLFANDSGVTVVETAIGATEGKAVLNVSDRFPTVTTINAAWREARAKDADFAQVRWDREIEIEVTTLDRLIDRVGEPAFVKIDVEGAEALVLAGLSRPIRALSFEYLPKALGEAHACTARLAQLGRYEYNYVVGERGDLASPRWLDRSTLLAELEKPLAQSRPGDVYARVVREG